MFCASLESSNNGLVPPRVPSWRDHGGAGKGGKLALACSCSSVFPSFSSYPSLNLPSPFGYTSQKFHIYFSLVLGSLGNSILFYLVLFYSVSIYSLPISVRYSV